MDAKTNGQTTAAPTTPPPPAPAAIQTMPRAPLAFEPTTIDEAFRLSKMLATSNLLPDALRDRPENVLLTLMTGHELGLSPMQSLRLVCIVKGKPYLYASLKLARVKNSAACKRFKMVSSTTEKAVFETERDGEGVTTLEFTMDDARRAGLLTQGKNPEESNWAKYPAVMLRWRAISQLCDVVYPDIVQNVGAVEELVDGRPTEVDRGFLERAVPSDVAAPPAPITAQESPAVALAGAPAVGPITPQSGAGQPPQEVSPKRAKIEEAPPDPVEIEVAALKKAIQEAKTRKELQSLSNRVLALPDVERKPLTDLYQNLIGNLPKA